jgi:hypothetical protein
VKLNLNALPSDGRELRMIRAAAAPTAAFAGLLLAAVVGSGPAGADSAGSGSTNDPIHDAVEEFGQSLCPKLVKPGSDLATAVSEIQGNSGLAPTVTGMITGLAIQLECPAFMTSLANGKLPEALQQAGNKPDSPMPQLPSLLPSPAIPKASPNK